MSIPQPWRFSRSEQTSYDAVGGEQIRVPHREGEPFAEDPAGGRLGRIRHGLEIRRNVGTLRGIALRSGTRI